MNRFRTLLSGCFLCLGLLGPLEASSETRILFVGDTHFGENYQEGRSDNILASEGYQYTIQNFSAFLRGADAVIANLETPITDLEESPYDDVKSYVHWADPVLTPHHLLSNNISVVSLANNHSLDYGVEGILQTLEVLEGEGISAFGAGLNKDDAARPYIRQFQVGDRTFTLGVIGAFAYSRTYDEDYHFYADDTTPGTYALSAADIGAQVASLKAEHPGIFIVAFPHWGSNYRWKTDAQTEVGHALVDSGVDMVIGHGAHMMQEVERYHDRWIVYSLGNLVFNSKGRYESYDAPPYGFILELALKDNGAAVAADFRLYPIFTDNRITNFQSRYVSESEFDEAEALLLEMGDLGSGEAAYIVGRDGSGSHYLEFPLIDGFVETEFDDLPESVERLTLKKFPDRQSRMKIKKPLGLELLRSADGAFTLNGTPEMLRGEWRNSTGSGTEFKLTLDSESLDRLLARLSREASGESGTSNIVVKLKRGTSPKLKLSVIKTEETLETIKLEGKWSVRAMVPVLKPDGSMVTKTKEGAYKLKAKAMRERADVE